MIDDDNFSSMFNGNRLKLYHKPLFKLLLREINFHWSKECQLSFDVLKEYISSDLMLRGTNCSLPFHISIDASDWAIGKVLGQKENILTHSIYFIRKKFSPC